MSLSEFLSAASEAWGILAAFPIRWIAVVVVFLVVVESLMLIPYVGFVAKLGVAGIVAAQVVAMFAGAAVGEKPSPVGMVSAFSLPIGAQAALAAAALLPFAVGMVFLYARGGLPAIRFFFGNIFRDQPPSQAQFEQFKYVMQSVALPLMFLAGAVVIKGLSGVSAICAALAAAAAHWLPVLLLGLLGLAFEWISAQVPSVMPKPAAAAVSIVLLVFYLAWSFAITYTVSAKVFAPADSERAAQRLGRPDVSERASGT